MNLVVAQAGVFGGVDISEVTLQERGFRKWDNSQVIGGVGCTNGLLGEDGSLRNALDLERVPLLDEEPLQISGGHFEEEER